MKGRFCMDKMYDLADKYLAEILIDRSITKESYMGAMKFFLEKEITSEQQVALINEIIKNVVITQKLLVFDETLQYLETYLTNIFLKSVFKYGLINTDVTFKIKRQDNRIIVLYNYCDCFNYVKKTVIQVKCIIILNYIN